MALLIPASSAISCILAPENPFFWKMILAALNIFSSVVILI
jgi:hypothetical protein